MAPRSRAAIIDYAMTSLAAQSVPLNSGSSSSAAAAGRKPIRVLLADDHPAVRVGMRQLIDDQPDMEVVFEAHSAEEALGGGERSEDVVVLDYHLGGSRDGLWVTRQLKRRSSPPRVLIYSAFADSALAAAALVAGADGLLSKTSLGEELCDAIRALARGRRYLPAIPQTVAQALCSQLQPGDRAIFGMLLADVEPDEITERLRMPLGQLDDRRGIMLRALAPTSRMRSEADAPLDYERPRRQARHKVERRRTTC